MATQIYILKPMELPEPGIWPPFRVTNLNGDAADIGDIFGVP
jgi:hypothetical protein